MSLKLFKPDENGHSHKILVGSSCAYCMDCGKILIEYENVNYFKKLMNPFEDDE